MLDVLRQTLRSLIHRKAFTAFSVVLLALGVGAIGAILAIVSATFLRPLPYRAPGDLYVAQGMSPVARDSLAPSAIGAMQLTRLRDGSSTLSIEGYTPTTFAITGAGDPFPVPGAVISAGLFDVLGIHPLLGHGFDRTDEHPHSGVVLISHGLWQRQFGARANILGTTIVVDGEPRTIIGVMPRDFTLALQPGDAWLPMALGEDETARLGTRMIATIARLKPGATAFQAKHDLDGLNSALAREYPDAFRGSRMDLVPLKESLFGTQRTPLVILTIAVILVMLIAAANIINLSLADAVNRRNATLTRLAFGASRAAIVRARLIDALVITTVGTALGVLCGRLILAALMRANANAFVGTPANDTIVTGLTIAAGLVVGILTALPAAFAESSFSIASLASSAIRSVGGVSERRARELLVASQMAITLLLLVGATVLVRRARELLQHSPGFEPTGVVAVQMTVSNTTYSTLETRGVYVGQLLAAIRNVPGVVSASSIQTRFVLNETMQTSIGIEGRPPEPGVQDVANIRNVMPDIIPTLQMRLREGRGIDATDQADGRPVAVVSASLARKYWGRESAIGKRIKRTSRPNAPWLDIVGVVDDVEDQGVGVPPGPTLYVPYLQQNTPTVRVTLLARVRGTPEAMAKALRNAVWSVDRNQVIEDVSPLRSLLVASAAGPRFQALVVTLFGAAAFILVLCGVYALTLFGVLRRTRELGVRAALGARPGALLRYSMWQGVRPMLGGFLAGSLAVIPLIIWAPQSLRHIVDSRDIPTLMATGLILMASGALAAWLPALRATRISPMTAMRT